MSVYPRFSIKRADDCPASPELETDDIYVSHDPASLSRDEDERENVKLTRAAECGPPPPCPGTFNCSFSSDSGIKDPTLSTEEVCQIIKATVAPLEKKIDDLTTTVHTLVTEIISLKERRSRTRSSNSYPSFGDKQGISAMERDETESGSTTPVDNDQINYCNTCLVKQSDNRTNAPIYTNFENFASAKDLVSINNDDTTKKDSNDSDEALCDFNSVEIQRNNSYYSMNALLNSDKVKEKRKGMSTLQAPPVTNAYTMPPYNKLPSQKMPFGKYMQCSVCKLVSTVNVKRFADILWANDELADGLYSQVCSTCQSTGTQGLVWKEVLSSINCFPDKAKHSIKLLVEFIAQYNPELSLELNTLSIRCGDKLMCCCKYAAITL